MNDAYETMDLLQLRAECQKRVAEGRTGWHDTKQWIRFGRAVELKAALRADRAPVAGEKLPEPPPAPSVPAPEAKPAPTQQWDDNDKPKPTQAPIPTPTGDAGLGALGQLLAGIMEPYLVRQKVDLSALTEKVEQQIASLDERVQKRIDDLRPIEKVIFIDREKGTRKESGTRHKQYAKASSLILSRREGVQNMYLVGPAGTGKSHMAKDFAEDIGARFFLQSCGLGTQEYHFWGHTDANGNYMQTPTYQAFTCDGPAVLCIDEIDASSPDVGLVLNAITNGDMACFPHPIGCLHRPKQLYVIATGNTLNGADERYAARYEMDGALKNRFAVYHWGHDEDLEAALYGQFPIWTKYVQACRAEVDKQRIPYVVSSRNIELGQSMLASGDFSKSEVEEIALWASGSLPVDKQNMVRKSVKDQKQLVWG